MPCDGAWQSRLSRSLCDSSRESTNASVQCGSVVRKSIFCLYISTTQFTISVQND